MQKNILNTKIVEIVFYTTYLIIHSTFPFNKKILRTNNQYTDKDTFVPLKNTKLHNNFNVPIENQQ